ncbi:hypothetical protein jhhlp_007867 [Lomentospora prolificans]|uniref:Major facilitator superfamily (MFS) profile domain-containing protein n=1 Tax=Lomentospora prolificans TaxID=41688 RepID=A0A2N3N0S7_9PEZI|nr:hypothetical protein jhhlp_007867 [Lomentospora prolificans]
MARNSGLDWNDVHHEKRWTVLSLQKRFFLWALYTSIGSMMLGFDFGIAGTATAYPAFQRAMGVPFPDQPSGYLIPAHVQSAWSGVSTGGDAVGILISGQLMDRIGRKWTILIGAIITAAGIGVQVGSNDWKEFLAGRLVNAIGFGMVFIISPVWIGENARPELRGFCLCLMNGSIVLGQFVLALVAYGTDSIQGKWSYQTLIVLQFAFVLFILLGIPFFPESPYWHLQNSRDEEARKCLQRLHGNQDQELIEAEMVRIKEVIRSSEELAAAANAQGPPAIQIFKGTNLKRTIIAILPAAAQQLIGAAFVLGYITYFLSLLGIKEYFKVSVALYCVMLASNASAFPLIETTGRRPLLLIGIVALTVIELIMGIMGVINNAASLWVTLVCIFLWAIFYQVSIGAVGLALGSEVASPALRATTISALGLTQTVVGWLIGFISPYMINPDAGNLGAKVGFVFAGLGVPLCILFYFLIPETMGLTYEDMDHLFDARVPPRHFKREALRRRVEQGEAPSSENEKADGSVQAIEKEG